jgi:dTDP-4-amino-4,6-dideoxygalactose transaminase
LEELLRGTMIPFSKPSIKQEEMDAVVEVLNSGWLTIGDKVKEFERDLGAYTGLYIAAVDSCTSALTLSMLTINDNYRENTAVIPALTFIATANAAYNAFYNIDFCDVDWDGNINVNLLKDRNYLVVPVHFAGQVCDIKAIQAKSAHIIEDAAHAVGAFSQGKHVGYYTDGACFSFYPTKNMTTIEGGAFATTDDRYFEIVKTYSLHGLGSSHITRYERSSIAKPKAEFIGFKANMTNVEAAIGIVQLRKLNSFIQKRKKVAEIYRTELKDKIKFLDNNGRDHVWHMVVGLVTNRDNVVTRARALGVGLGIHYSPIIPAHPVYKEMTGYKMGQFPVAEYIADHCISLPLYNDITDEEVEKVIEVMKGLL